MPNPLAWREIDGSAQSLSSRSFDSLRFASVAQDDSLVENKKMCLTYMPIQPSAGVGYWLERIFGRLPIKIECVF